MSTAPAPVSVCIALVLLIGTLAVIPRVHQAYAQTATDSATNSATSASSSSSSTSSSSSLPSSLPESGSNDVAVTFGLGAFLILAGFVGRATLAQLLREP